MCAVHLSFGPVLSLRFCPGSVMYSAADYWGLTAWCRQEPAPRVSGHLAKGHPFFLTGLTESSFRMPCRRSPCNTFPKWTRGMSMWSQWGRCGRLSLSQKTWALEGEVALGEKAFKILHQMFHALSYREVQRVPGLTVVIYNQEKVLGSLQEAKGFPFHSCFPFLWFMIVVAGRSLLESSELSALSMALMGIRLFLLDWGRHSSTFCPGRPTFLGCYLMAGQSVLSPSISGHWLHQHQGSWQGNGGYS